MTKGKVIGFVKEHKKDIIHIAVILFGPMEE